MTGRERVLRTLRFENPDRPPRDLWPLPAVQLFQRDEYKDILKRYPMDIGFPRVRPPSQDKGRKNTPPPERYKDNWGSVWHVAEPGVVGEVKEPVLADWAALDGYDLPWHLIERRDASHVDRSCEESDRFMLSHVAAQPFERLQFLRGTENTFMDILENSAEFRKLLEMLHAFYRADIEWWCKTSVDAVFLMDDWGTMHSLLIDPDIWRAVFKPLYREYCELIHGAGKYAFFHTDGHTAAIYGDLIEVGMDAINSQLFVMDIEELATKYKGKVTFWGELDRQHTMPFGSPNEVRESVMRVRRALDDGRGGVFAQFEWGKKIPVENVAAAYEAWLEPV